MNPSTFLHFSHRILQSIGLCHSPCREACVDFLCAHLVGLFVLMMKCSKHGASPVFSIGLIWPFLIWSRLSSPVIIIFTWYYGPHGISSVPWRSQHSLPCGPSHGKFPLPRVLFSPLLLPTPSFSSQIWHHFLPETLLSPLDQGWSITPRSFSSVTLVS